MPSETRNLTGSRFNREIKHHLLMRQRGGVNAVSQHARVTMCVYEHVCLCVCTLHLTQMFYLYDPRVQSSHKLVDVHYDVNR